MKHVLCQGTVFLWFSFNFFCLLCKITKIQNISKIFFEKTPFLERNFLKGEGYCVSFGQQLLLWFGTYK